MERACRRLRRTALSLPCKAELQEFGLRLGTVADDVVRCLHGRILADLKIGQSEDASWGVQERERLAAALLPMAARWARCSGATASSNPQQPQCATLEQAGCAERQLCAPHAHRRLHLKYAVPLHVLRALHHAGSLRQLEIELEGSYNALPFKALAALPSLASLHEIKFTHWEGEVNRRHRVDKQAALIGRCW